VIAMRAQDVMSRPVHIVRADDTIEHATALLASHSVTAAPVLDSSGGIVGMVSEGDLLQRWMPTDLAPHARDGRGRPTVVADVMTEDVVAMRAAADLTDLAHAMIDYNVRSVPIVEEGELVGIVSRRDILRAFVRPDDSAELEVQHRLDAYSSGERRWTAMVTGGMATLRGDFADAAEQSVVTALAVGSPGISTVLSNPAPAGTVLD
jgi:CBS domain-containing protein